MTIQDTIEKIRDIINKPNLKQDDILSCNALLSSLRTAVNVHEKHIQECQVRQNVYAEVAEKIWNRVIDKQFNDL